MWVKKKKVLVLMMIISLVISSTGCTSPPKPTTDENSGKFGTSVAQESSKAQVSSDDESSTSPSSDDESSVLEVQKEEHQDGDIYMIGDELTLYKERLEQCENWLGKTHAEAGIPDKFKGTVNLEGTIFGFPAHGAAFYVDGKCYKITIYTSNKEVSHSELFEMLTMENGKPYETTMGDYVESLGGCVTRDYFATGKGTIILETAELRNYCVLTFTPNQAPEHEPTEGELPLKEIKEGTGFDFTFPEDDYHNLSGGKVEGSELNWYYLNFTMDDGVFCQIDLIDDVTEEAAEKLFGFDESMKDKIVTEYGYSMVIDEEKKKGAIFWWEWNTAWLITVEYDKSRSVVDYDYLRQLRLAIIAAYEQPE